MLLVPCWSAPVPAAAPPAKGKAPAVVAPPPAPVLALSPMLPPPPTLTDGELNAASTGGADDVPKVLVEMPRDRARLAMVKREREVSLADARWLPQRLDALDGAVADPGNALVFSSI